MMGNGTGGDRGIGWDSFDADSRRSHFEMLGKWTKNLSLKSELWAVLGWCLSEDVKSHQACQLDQIFFEQKWNRWFFGQFSELCPGCTLYGVANNKPSSANGCWSMKPRSIGKLGDFVAHCHSPKAKQYGRWVYVRHEGQHVRNMTFLNEGKFAIGQAQRWSRKLHSNWTLQRESFLWKNVTCALGVITKTIKLIFITIHPL